jgi:pilus assembly protein CpaB
MSIRTIGAILLALLCGGAVAILVATMSGRVDTGSTVIVETDPLVVAARDIARGTMIDEKDITVVVRPRGSAHKASMMRPEDVMGRVALSQFLDGEAILEPKLLPKNGGRGLAALIPLGMRAVTIQATRVASNVAGFILPGNKVDVLLNLRGGQNDGTGGGSTTTLLQAVDVLACGQQTEAPEDSKMDPRAAGSVTLLVTPAQAALLDLGQNMGQLTLSLRNLRDTAEAVTAPATMGDIRFRQEKPAVEGAGGKEQLAATITTDEEPRERWILTLRGNQRGRVQLYGSR